MSCMQSTVTPVIDSVVEHTVFSRRELNKTNFLCMDILQASVHETILVNFYF